MDPFRSIHAFLDAARRAALRREAARHGVVGLAVLALVLACAPLATASLAAGRADPIRWAALALVLATAAVVALRGFLLPRRRLRRDVDVARLVGQASPPVASDLLSAVQLEPELGAGARFSPELAGALAETTAARLARLDPRVVAPPGAVRRGVRWLAGAVGVHLLFVLLLPGMLALGWERLLEWPGGARRGLEATSVPEPLVGDIRLTLTYPAYMRRAPLVVPVASGDVVAPRGTRVSLETTALHPAASARLVFEGPAPPAPPGRRAEPAAAAAGPAVALAVDGRRLRGEFRVEKAGQFRFLLQPAGGPALVEAEPHRIELEPDRAPKVELFAPADELDVSSRRRIELAYSIDDDHGISEIALVWRTAGGKEERKPLPPPRRGGRSAQAKFFWDLSEVALPPGARVAYHLEAKDNDNVGGPNVGVSRTFHLRVFSARERHEQALARQQAFLDAALAHLAVRVAPPADGEEARPAPSARGSVAMGERRREVVAGMEQLVLELGGLLSLLAQDTLSPKALRNDLEAMRVRLGKLLRDEQGLVQRSAGRGAFADHDRGTIAELERDALLLDDWLSRQRLEELLAIADELRQHRGRLASLMERYARTRTPELRAEIEREMRAIEQRIAELQAKAARMSGEVADRFVNADALDAQDAEDCFGQVRALLDKGDVAAATVQLERCGRMAEAQAQALERGLRGLRGERFAAEEKAFAELLGEVGDLERDQRQLAGDTDGIMERYRQRAAEAARAKDNPHKERAKKTLEKLRREVDGLPQSALTPFSQEEVGALRQRLEDIGRMLTEGDVAEALAMAKHAQEGLRTIEADLEQETDEGAPWSSRGEEALERVARADGLAKQLIDELKQATPSPEEMLDPADRRRLSELRRRQQQLQERAQRLAQKAQKRGRELPGTAGEVAQKGIEQAAEQMGRARQRFGATDPMGARDEARGAAEKLGELQQQMGKAARPSTVGGNGRDPDEEPVRIPGSEEYKPPERFREDILDAMKKDRPPESYKDQVKRYYEELVK